ncbi:MAG: cupin domain-containing protein [Desulfobacterales bacterium]|nr:cupin domain-containing protein [Desulfobacterales bacterium]
MDSNKSFFQMLVDIRDEQRRRTQSGTAVARGKNLPWENTPHGKLKWYMHPKMDQNVLQSHVIYVQEILPAGRSGVQRHPGGMLIYFIQGHGRTILDGEQIAWKAEDLLMLPLRPEGVVFQHINDSAEEALLFACEPNLVHTLGVDRGSRWEQVEPAPETMRQP